MFTHFFTPYLKTSCVFYARNLWINQFKYHSKRNQGSNKCILQVSTYNSIPQCRYLPTIRIGNVGTNLHSAIYLPTFQSILQCGYLPTFQSYNLGTNLHFDSAMQVPTYNSNLQCRYPSTIRFCYVGTYLHFNSAMQVSTYHSILQCRCLPTIRYHYVGTQLWYYLQFNSGMFVEMELKHLKTICPFIKVDKLLLLDESKH